MAARAQGLAADNAFDGQPASTPGAVEFYRLFSVARARRREPALVADQRRQHASIEVNQPDKKRLHGRCATKKQYVYNGRFSYFSWQ